MLDTHDTSSALHRLVGFLLMDPSNLRLRREAVSQALKAADWDAAIELAQPGVLAQPDDTELLAMQGLALLRRGRFPESAIVLGKAAANENASGAIRFNLACALFLQSRYAEALDKLGPPELAVDCPELDLMRARCFHRSHQLAAATQACETFLGRKPDDIEARGLLALLYVEAGRMHEARMLADSALAGDPAQLEALLAVAGIEAAARNHGAAKAGFARVVGEHPECGRGWLGLAMALAFEQDIDAATEAAATASKFLADHIGTWHVLGWLSLISFDLDTAQHAFDKALALDRNFGETHGALAAIAALRGNERDAQEGIRRAARLDPFASSVYYARYAIALRAGNREEARAQLDAFTATRSKDGDSTVREMLASVLRDDARS